jgi:hypothetical protein
LSVCFALQSLFKVLWGVRFYYHSCETYFWWDCCHAEGVARDQGRLQTESESNCEALSRINVRGGFGEVQSIGRYLLFPTME